MRSTVPTPQKNSAHPSERRFQAAAVRICSIMAAAVGMGVVGYLISQHYDGLLTASLASALTTLSLSVTRR